MLREVCDPIYPGPDGLPYRFVQFLTSITPRVSGTIRAVTERVRSHPGRGGVRATRPYYSVYVFTGTHAEMEQARLPGPGRHIVRIRAAAGPGPRAEATARLPRTPRFTFG
ncbi:hypothetical protein Ato02nite_072120 [Paractinoplanes toevensis]|uniref:Uncharacterized protein n=1 Tax=Paractinoplanes toevensis TaxID=571911 RepID=A0A919W5E4_9ACTN|nr:hypothetical protein Ato02nite_072120 [Actinoplanes toevensis]